MLGLHGDLNGGKIELCLAPQSFCHLYDPPTGLMDLFPSSQKLVKDHLLLQQRLLVEQVVNPTIPMDR